MQRFSPSFGGAIDAITEIGPGLSRLQITTVVAALLVVDLLWWLS